MERLVPLVRSLVKELKSIVTQARKGEPSSLEASNAILKDLTEILSAKLPNAKKTLSKSWDVFVIKSKAVQEAINLWRLKEAAKDGDVSQEDKDDGEMSPLSPHLEEMMGDMERCINTFAVEIKDLLVQYREAEKSEKMKSVFQKDEPTPVVEARSKEHAKRLTKQDLSVLIGLRPSKEELIQKNILLTETFEALVERKGPPPPRPDRKPSTSSNRSPVMSFSEPQQRTGTLSSISFSKATGKWAVGDAQTPPDTFILLKGEEVVMTATDVYYKHRSVGRVSWRRGTLTCTNYQLFFISETSGKILFSLPLGFVNNVERVGGRSIDSLQESLGSSSGYKLVIETKDYQKIHFNFEKDKQMPTRTKTFDTIRNLLQVPVNKLFAFSYLESFPASGWDLYDPIKEYNRIGINGEKSQWRLTTTNGSHRLCPTYPSVLCVPAKIYDTELVSIASFRSKGRIPVLCWLHPTNSATITRCSQPRVGIKRRRSPEDEKMIAEILGTNRTTDSVLQIVDARPRANARANQAKGAGTESMANYPNCILTFHDIANIHVMRDSLTKFSEACSSDDFQGEDSRFLASVESSGWLQHGSKILKAACKITDFVHEKAISVLVHCSDGWDRTPQLTSLSMIMLDPYYRTTTGFQVLIEKEWIGFGHQFALRTGHDGSTKYSERSPVFIQYLDCVYQIMHQFPCIFEFNETFLITILEEFFSNRWGTMLYDCERERKEANVRELTKSLWSYLQLNMASYRNPFYEPSDQVLYPCCSIKKLRVWERYHLRQLPELKRGKTMEDKAAEMVEMYEAKLKELNAKLKK